MSMVLTQGKCHSLNAECHEKQLKKRKKKKKNNIDLVILQKRSYSTLKG